LSPISLPAAFTIQARTRHSPHASPHASCEDDYPQKD
jgi:hypothetical protein